MTGKIQSVRGPARLYKPVWASGFEFKFRPDSVCMAISHNFTKACRWRRVSGGQALSRGNNRSAFPRLMARQSASENPRYSASPSIVSS